MFKLIGHVVVFAIGLGVGVYWGVHNPTDAVRLANIEQAKIDLARQQVLKATNPTPAPAPAPQPASP